jgi:hypothetical protein
MTDVSLVRCLRGIALVAFAAIVIPLTGCASTPMSRARTVISVTAESVVAVDLLLAPRYAALAGAAAADPEVVRRWNAVVTTLLVTRSSLLAAERSLDAIQAGQEGDIRGVLACVGSAVMRLVEALPEIGVRVPEALTMAMQLLSAFSGSCEPANETSVYGIPHASEAPMVSR